jgi:hypothetical protein
MVNIIRDNLEIMSQDLPGKMSWNSVPLQIEQLGGNGWRLPYESEFLIIYEFYRLGIGGFKPSRYWAYSSYLDKAWYYDLSVGYSPHIIDQSNEYYVRLVRNI